MTDVLFFSYRSTDNWWQYLAQSLNFTQSVAVVSDMRGDGTINIVDSFYTNLRENDCASLAIKHLSLPVCEEIIRRCRVLRNLKKQRAMSMIGAMWLAIDEVVKTEKPRLVMSFIIDRYVIDILDRVAQSYGIKFIGMTASIFPEHVMFMDRGKLIALRKPEKNEIELGKKQVLSKNFVPSYVVNNKKFSIKQYWRTFLSFKVRGLAYQFIRYIKQDRLNLHYLDALNYLDHKPRLGDIVVLKHLNQDWEKKLQTTAREKRVFIGLQLLPEASLDYWLDDLSLLNNEGVVLKICNVLGAAGYTLFVKDHPLQFGFRKRAFIQALTQLPFVVLIPYEATASRLISECPITVTFTGTIGFESVVAGACSIVSGAYYADEQHFVHFHNLDDIELLPEKIDEFHKNNSQISDEAIDKLIENILAASAPGDLFGFRNFDQNKPECVEKAAELVQTLNLYLSQFLKAA